MDAQDFAIKVASDVETPNKKLAIEIILAIVSVLIQECVLSYFRVKNPSFLDKIRLRWKVRSYTKEQGVAEALLKHASTLTEEEFLDIKQSVT